MWQDEDAAGGFIFNTATGNRWPVLGESLDLDLDHSAYLKL